MPLGEQTKTLRKERGWSQAGPTPVPRAGEPTQASAGNPDQRDRWTIVLRRWAGALTESLTGGC